MKNFFKKYSLFLFILVACFFLGGCSAEYNVVLKENGLIESSISINLTGLESEKSERVISGLSVYFKQLDEAFEENTISLYSNIYNFEELKLEKNEEKTAYVLGRNGYIVNDSEIEIDPTRKKVVYKKSFYSLSGSLSRSLTAYYLYFYPSALEYNKEANDIVLSASYKSLMDDIPLSSKLELDEGVFMAKYIQTANPLYYNGEEPKFLYDFSGAQFSVSEGTTLKEFLLNVTGLSEQQLNIMFNFTTPYHRVHSNGKLSQNGSGITHSWVLGDVNSTVTFYRNMSRPIWWYVICAGVGVVIIIAGLIAGIVVKNHKKKVGMDALKKIDELANKK